jgi:hypothetical protein
MQISNMVESPFGVFTGTQAAATTTLLNRFLLCGNDLLNEDGAAVMPANARILLEKLAIDLRVSMEGRPGVVVKPRLLQPRHHEPCLLDAVLATASTHT